MAQDQQSYRRAANAALVGLVVQVLLTIGMGLAGLNGQSPPLYSATWQLLGGLPIWIVLWLLYNQHGQERAEALETERLSRNDANAASIFEDHADDLQLARRRLNNLYKWGLGTVSVIVAVYLLGMGTLQMWLAAKSANANLLIEHSFRNTNRTELYLGIVSLAIAFFCFVVARYEAGMTKIPQWGVLRGGAAYLMGNFVVALLCAAGLFARSDLIGRPEVLAWMSWVIPGIMLFQGAEILLTFLLNAYRPRRPGEIPRPAFDSRVLGLLTSPKSLAKALSDAINYQFGFEVSRSWFYQLLGKAITPLVLFALLALFLISSIVMVQPHQKAIALRMGNIVRDGEGKPVILEPGPHLVLPWPFGSSETFDVGRVLQISVGSAQQGIDPNKAILWTTPHAAGGAKEEYMVTAPTSLPDDSRGAEADEAGQTPGSALIGLQLVVQYRIRSDKAGFLDYVQQSENPGTLLSRIAERSLSHYLVTQDTDAILGEGRITAGAKLKQEIQAQADANKLGLEVVYVAMAGVHPPSDADVAKAFHQQIAVRQEVEGLIQDAQKDEIQTLATVAGSPEQARAVKEAIDRLSAARNALEVLRRDPSAATPAQLEGRERELRQLEAEVEDQLARASGRAATLIYEARAARWQNSLSNRARAASFIAELSAYRQAPGYYRAKRYLDVLAEGLGGNTRKIVIATDNVERPLFVLDLTDPGTAIGDLFPNN